MSAGPIVLAPGAYDGLTARLVARFGFPAVYMTGAGTSVSHGYPDYGLLTLTEMVENAARITAAADIPVIADADTGYGNELNVVRTVRAYTRAGVAAIHIEDQTLGPPARALRHDRELGARCHELTASRVAAGWKLRSSWSSISTWRCGVTRSG